jgi:hypothetical protein
MPKSRNHSKIAREVDEILSRPLSRSRYEQGSPVVIDHSDIPRDDLRIAKNNAARDPDGQVFPWESMYPLAGSTVYYDGKLWTVFSKGRDNQVRLVGQGHDDMVFAPLGELRPITWTQGDEDRFSR